MAAFSKLPEMLGLTKCTECEGDYTEAEGEESTKCAECVESEPFAKRFTKCAALVPLRPLWPGFTYFPHQEVGIRWMLDKEEIGTIVDDVVVRGGFQCDDMGLGKTIQITATMVNRPVKETLLVAPLAMLDTWIGVLQRAGMGVHTVKGNAWVKLSGGGVPRHFIKMRPQVFVCNYEKLVRPSLFSRSWGRVVLDEAHKIRSATGKAAVAAGRIVAPVRWAVTGTPLVNSLNDVVSLLAFVGVPFAKPLAKKSLWERRFNTLFPQLTLHRTLDSIRSVVQGAPPVPVVHEEVLPFVTEEEDDFYHGVQGENEEGRYAKYASEYLSPVEMFKLLLRLRQLSVHPQVYINAKRREGPYDREDWVGATTKLERLAEIIMADATPCRPPQGGLEGLTPCRPPQGGLEGGLETANQTPAESSTPCRPPQGGLHKYIVFCQFTEEMSLIREFLLRRGLADDQNILLYHGGMTQSERAAVLAHSKKSTDTTVLLLQLQAGGVGLNLQEYDRIVFMSPWWTSALMDQAIARAVRMGQSEVVHVYHLRLASENTKTINIDSLVNAKADEKRKMLNRLFSL